MRREKANETGSCGDLNKDQLYQAFKSRDSRFDGKVFVGVKSTGVYCRPVCIARMPKKDNCEFFETAAEAEQAGFRPCMTCRPELAPGLSISDATSNLARRAARLLRNTCGEGQSLEVLAGRLGCTDRHLRRIFTETYHLTPVQYLQTCRLLLAKHLLTDSNLPIGSIAAASGFGSTRRFNEAFKNRYRMPPSALRKKESKFRNANKDISLKLGYRPPYLWDEMLAFLEMRAIAGIESVEDGTYLRTVRIFTEIDGEVTGWIKVSNLEGENALALMLSESLLPVITHVVARVRHLFDLDCEPQVIYETLKQMNEVKAASCKVGTRLPGCFDSFETAARAIIGQWVSVKTASNQAAKVVAEYGQPIDTGIDGLDRAFPSPEWVASRGEKLLDDFGRLGITSARSKAILELARAIVDGHVSLDLAASPTEQMENMLALKGIGPWTAQYVAMRTLGYTDAFLETDAGVKHALPEMNAKEMCALAEAWRPWRSYAVMNLWNSL